MDTGDEKEIKKNREKEIKKNRERERERESGKQDIAFVCSG
jgi:hypothetical protein